jgi:hypothetical protein
MAQGNGAASDVDLSGIQAEFSIDRDRTHGKSFIDFEQVHRCNASTRSFKQGGDRFGMSGRKPCRIGGVARVADDFCHRLEPQYTRFVFRHNDDGCRAIANRRGVARSDRAV